MQKFKKYDLVRVAKNLGLLMDHFEADVDAIVIGSYADQYGGNNTRDYTLYIHDYGRVSWYCEHQLTLIKHDQKALLDQWENEKESETKQKSDIDWIFEHGDEVLKNPHGASIQTLASCLGIDNLWGSRGEGMTYYSNAMGTLKMAKPFLETNDKAGWLNKANEMKRINIEKKNRSDLIYNELKP